MTFLQEFAWISINMNWLLWCKFQQVPDVTDWIQSEMLGQVFKRQSYACELDWSGASSCTAEKFSSLAAKANQSKEEDFATTS